MLSPPAHFKHPPQSAKIQRCPRIFFKNTFDSWTGTEERKELKRTRVGEAPAGEPLVAVTVTEDEKVAGLGRGGRGSTTPPTLATYLPSPTFPSLLTTPCPRSLFSSLREFTFAPWTRHTSAIFHPLPMSANFTPTPCPRSPFSSLREFTLAPWTRHTSLSLTISKNLRTIFNSFNSFKKRFTPSRSPD